MTISIKNTKKKISIIFWILCIMLNSSYAYVLIDDSVQLVSLFIAGVVSTLFLFIGKKICMRKDFLFHPWIFLCWAILFVMVISDETSSWGVYLHQICILFVAVVFSMSFSVEKFMRVLAHMLSVCTILSLIIWVATNIFNIKLPLPIIITNSESLYNGIIVFANVNEPLRMMGPFWEPGIFASALCVTLFFIHYYDVFQKKGLITLVLILGIIFTFSTAGYLLFSILVAVKVINSQKGKGAIGISLLFVLFFILLFVYSDKIILYLATINPNMFAKMTFRSNSMTTRIMGPFIDLKLFAMNPFWGCGMKNYNLTWPEIAILYSNVVARTSTITFFLANFGVSGILYFYVLVKAIVKQDRLLILSKILLLFFFIALLSKEPNYFNLLINICILYLYNTSNKPKENYNEQSVSV